MSAEFVIYRGDEVVTVGTAAECAERMGVSEATVRWYASPACKRRAAESGGARITAERVEE